MSSLLKTHFDAIERVLLAQFQVQAPTGHSANKGTPREALVREFLENHLSERVRIGTGEIIDANAKAGEKRNQIDAVVYKHDYPRLALGGGVHAFLAESVVSTIEVKSTLTKDELELAAMSARNVKALHRSVQRPIRSGYQPPGILCFLVAYAGPASMKTVADWIVDIHRRNGIKTPDMAPRIVDRLKVPSPSLDGIFVLGKGFLVFDSMPVFFLGDDVRMTNPSISWIHADTQDGNLFMLFTLLTAALGGASLEWLDPMPYVGDWGLRITWVAESREAVSAMQAPSDPKA